MLRQNWFIDVAMPSRERSTLCWIASRSDSIEKPMPAPVTKHAAYSARRLEAGVSACSPTKPAVRITEPAIATRR